VPQFLVLMNVYRPARHGWRTPTQSAVAASLAMDANTASQIVRGLASRGVLERPQHPHDRRARLLVLTTSGIELCRVASATARAVNDLFFSAIAPEQRDLLTALLETVTTASENRS
jgi:DNA-binding MarR family transcriptional regulator